MHSSRYHQNKQPYVPPQQRQQSQPEISLQEVDEFEAKESNKLVAQTVINLQNVSAITLRTGKQVQGSEGAQEDEDKKKEDKHIFDNGGPSEPSLETTTDKSRLVSCNSSSKNSSSSYSPPPPYPNRLKPRKKNGGIRPRDFKYFQKDVVKQIPKYAKFFKELCTNKRCIKDNKVVSLGRNVSGLIKKHIEIPRKCKDPGMFSVLCVIGNLKLDNVMLDLGASINVMPLSMFTFLSLRPLKTTGVVIQLANRSTVNPVGCLKTCLSKRNQSNNYYLGKTLHDDITNKDRRACMIIDNGDRRRESAVQHVGSWEAPD
ncbi:hypothetical protein V8G54_009746 [Vigna mungo]|uniref:Aspartic peptidase DDI1-type domain-containing protein n=1 Tax=Vigna mungo TaxID=3915 RepID=A0AAQ3S2F2_VIGMU